MTTNPDQDTDPSTPGAKRLSDPRSVAAPEVPEDASSIPKASSLRPTTDPGIAPPPGPRPVPEKPMGIVVPPAAGSGVDHAPAARRGIDGDARTATGRQPHESVDSLLDGIAREVSDPIESTSQTRGQTTAAYYAQHSIRSARMPEDEEPKVVIARPPLQQTLRVPRSHASPSTVGARDSDGTSQAAGPNSRLWDATTPQPLIGRVTIAVIAGLVVATTIFMALRRVSSEGPQQTGASTPASTATSVPPAMATSGNVAAAPMPTQRAPTIASGSITAAAAETAPSATPSAAAASAARKVAPAPPPNKTRPKPSASATKSGPSLGEFKASF
jgi:hypothetical protein